MFQNTQEVTSVPDMVPRFKFTDEVTLDPDMATLFKDMDDVTLVPDMVAMCHGTGVGTLAFLTWVDIKKT